MADEFHVASLLVHALPEKAAAVAAVIEQMPASELHGHSPEGKIIVVVEAGNEQTITDRLNTIQSLPGVLSAALVYHEVDDAGAHDGVARSDGESASRSEPAKDAAP